ncbi:MAG: FAD-dependent oxidoreductase [Patescibacteria group bacterium]
MVEKNELLDLVIIGAAAAGSSAAVYAARRKLNFVVVAKDIGGEVALSGEVENWPGIIKTTGIELAKNFHEHMKSYGVKIDEGMEVASIKKEKNYHIVSAKDSLGKEKQYQTKAVIVASGIHPRELKIPGEKKYRGLGVTYCTVCDGPLFHGKITATIGAGNAALESALMMGEIAQKVYLITKYPNDKENGWGFPKGENILVDKVKKLKNIEIVYNANTKEIVGDKMVAGVKYEDQKTKEIKGLAVQGVMAHVGMIPNSDFVTCGKKNKLGEIMVTPNARLIALVFLPPAMLLIFHSNKSPSPPDTELPRL